MNRRKRKLIRTDLQFKVVFITLFVASFVLLVDYQLVLAALWSLSSKVGSDTDPAKLLNVVERAVTSRFLLSLAIAVPLSVSVAILYSFRFCGPIYKFKKYLTEMAAGARWDRPCTLRSGDQLTDLRDAINDTVAQFRERLEASNDLLAEVDSVLDAGVAVADEASRERIRKIRERIAAESAIFGSRMGEGDPEETHGAIHPPETVEAAS